MFDTEVRAGRRALPLLLLAALVLVGGGAAAALWGGSDGADLPTIHRELGDEVELEEPAADDEARLAGRTDRETVEMPDVLAADTSVEVGLRGRVVDPYCRPIAGAEVLLAIGQSLGGAVRRGGRHRAVPDPVLTDSEGRFAFRRQAFRNLRVSLQIFHPQHAPLIESRDVGDIAREVIDLGDLQMQVGAVVTGRVTDLAGNAIADAKVEFLLQPRGRWMAVRNRERLEPEIEVDREGVFRIAHLRPGSYRARATAPQHQSGTSATLELADLDEIDIGDIPLERGYRVTGTVSAVDGRPIRDAEVSLRPTGWRPSGRALAPGRGVRAGPSDRGPVGRGSGEQSEREFRGATDRDGNFTIDHLPNVPMVLHTTADGYLDHAQTGVLPLESPHLTLRLEDGLVIAGIVSDSMTNAPVMKYAVRADRVSDRRRGILGGRGRRDRTGRYHEVDQQADGRFRLAGLQEGVYVVEVHSPDHQRYRSERIEIRVGAPVADVRIGLARGL